MNAARARAAAGLTADRPADRPDWGGGLAVDADLARWVARGGLTGPVSQWGPTPRLAR